MCVRKDALASSAQSDQSVQNPTGCESHASRSDKLGSESRNEHDNISGLPGNTVSTADAQADSLGDGRPLPSPQSPSRDSEAVGSTAAASSSCTADGCKPADDAGAVPVDAAPASEAVSDAPLAAEAPATASTPVTPATPRASINLPLLPPASDPARMTLVLDLDGTLIASEDEPHAPVPFDYCVDEERFVWLRPGLRRFLDAVRPLFEVVLFTAAGESWATCALQRIDPAGTIFDSRLYRDHTVSHDDWPWVKDLSRLGRDLSRVVIVDDNPLMFMYQPHNALHVQAYDPQLSGHNDDVLEQVLDVLLHKVLPASDVRDVLRDMRDPVTASCLAARQAAARAVAASFGSPASQPKHAAVGLVRGPPAAATAAAGGAAGSRAAATAGVGGLGGGGGSLTSLPLSALVPGALACGQGGGRAGRRARRVAKLQQPPQQREAAAGQHLEQELSRLQPWRLQHPHVQQPHVVYASPAPAERKARRRGLGQGQAGGAIAAVATAPQPAAAALAPCGLSVRPPLPPRPKQKQKHKLRAGASSLQQPEQQLHLKLRLLQLQREQEQDECQEGGGAAPAAAAAAPLPRRELGPAGQGGGAGGEQSSGVGTEWGTRTTTGELGDEAQLQPQPMGTAPQQPQGTATRTLGAEQLAAATARAGTARTVAVGTDAASGAWLPPPSQSLRRSYAAAAAAGTCLVGRAPAAASLLTAAAVGAQLGLRPAAAHPARRLAADAATGGGRDQLETGEETAGEETAGEEEASGKLGASGGGGAVVTVLVQAGAEGGGEVEAEGGAGAGRQRGRRGKRGGRRGRRAAAADSGRSAVEAALAGAAVAVAEVAA